MTTPLRKLALAGGVFALATTVLAKKADPLDRITPVPANEQIPVMDFFRPPLFRSPQLNDAGTHFAALVAAPDDRIALLVYDLTKGRFETVRGDKERDIYNFAWLTDKRIMFQLRKEKLYSSGLFVADLGRLASAYAVDRYNVVWPVGIPRKTPMRPIVWIPYSAFREGRDMGVLQLNAEIVVKEDFQHTAYVDPESFDYGTMATVVKSYPQPPDGIPRWYMADKDGALAFGGTAKEGVPALHRLVTSRWERCPVDLDEIDIIDAGDVADELIVRGPRQEGRPRALCRLDAATGEIGEVLLQDDRYDLEGVSLYRHPGDGRVLGARIQRSRPMTVWFDKEIEAIQSRIEGHFPDCAVSLMGSDKAQKRFLIAAWSDRKPTTYYCADLEKRSLGPVKNVHPWIDPERMAPMQAIRYKSRDGHSIEAYLTLPPGTSKSKPAPLVVLPHGGPWVRDTWGWDGEVQFLASRGYAVLQPNYRGSPGYGWEFDPGDDYAFRKMHDDVTDGTRALIASGLVDPNRIAIMGASFGAYLALCGVAYEPTLYRCAVAQAGVFDWEQMIAEARDNDDVRGRFEFLRRRLGDPKKEQEKFDDISPMRHVDQIKVPVFVAHGKEDIVASVQQSRRLVERLKENGVPHVARFESGEGHGMAYLENRIELYTEVEKFLARYLVPAGVGVAATTPP